MLSGELGVFQALLARLYISGGYMDVSEVVVIFDYGNITSQGPTDSPPDRLRALVLHAYFAIIKNYNHFRNIHVATTDVQTRQ